MLPPRGVTVEELHTLTTRELLDLRRLHNWAIQPDEKIAAWRRELYRLLEERLIQNPTQQNEP